MPRYARPHVTGGLFHVISRFRDGKRFLDLKEARDTYLRLLGSAVSKLDARLIAYCLMSTHVHLVLQLGNDRLGALTKSVNSPFASWINERRKGRGTVMADRPTSVLVHSDTYGMELIRYVHNNPVRAGLVKRARESDWSSHRVYLGLAKCPTWLATETVLGRTKKSRAQSRKEFDKFVDEGRFEPRRPELSGEVSRALARRIRRLLGDSVEMSYPVIGPDTFVLDAYREQVKRHQTRKEGMRLDLGVDEVINAVCDELDLDATELRGRSRRMPVAQARAMASWIWSHQLGLPQVELAEELHVRSATVSMLLGKLRRKGLSPEENELAERILNRLLATTDAGRKAAETVDEQPRVLLLRRKRR